MQLAELKPILTALAFPPAGLLLLALFGVLLALRHRRTGTTLAVLSLAALFVLSTAGASVWLAQHLLPQAPPAQPEQLRAVQAIVVLGGGVEPRAVEYGGTAQPSDSTLRRLRYGVWLARRSGKPLAFAGGIGWAGMGVRTESEGAVARRVLQEDFNLALRWLDDQSRDTTENARRMGQLMRPEGIRRIALVTDALHMPRAVAHFRAAGFEVLAAPTHYPAPGTRPLLAWLPSAEGLETTRAVLHEWVGQRLTGAGGAFYGDFTRPKAELP